MRFFVILFGALGVLASFLLMTRLWGLSQPILEYPNPFFEASGSSATLQGAQELTTSEPGSTAETSAQTPLWIQAWDEAPAADLGSPVLSSKTAPGTTQGIVGALWVPVFQNAQRELRLWPSDLPWSGSSTEAHQGPPLEQEKPRWKNHKILLQILSNSQNIHEQVAQAFADPLWKNQILLYSEIEVVVDSLRPLRPQWSYGSSSPDRLRFLTFDSLWILPAVHFPRDAWVGPLKNRSVSLLNENVTAELRRRKKKIVIGPIDSESAFAEALNWKPEALFFPKGKLPSDASRLRL